MQVLDFDYSILRSRRHVFKAYVSFSAVWNRRHHNITDPSVSLDELDLSLWDEDNKELVSFRDVKKLKRKR